MRSRQESSYRLEEEEQGVEAEPEAGLGKEAGGVRSRQGTSCRLEEEELVVGAGAEAELGMVT